MIKENVKVIQAKIDNALARRKQAMLTGDKVQLVAVTKTHPAETVQEALLDGLNVFGENKVQEADGKIAAVNGGNWHLIGHLQSNKVKKAVELFSLIYSVDSENLLLAIDKEAAKAGKVQDILLQVNIAEEESKFGVSLAQLPEIAKLARKLNNVQLRGLMIIAPEVDDNEAVRPVFRQGYQAFCSLKETETNSDFINVLSMGMSGDFEIAIEEGANNIRLGTLIFGRREYLR